MGCGKSLQGIGEFLQRFENWILAQIGECQTDMVGMVKGVVAYDVVFKTANEFLVGHVSLVRFVGHVKTAHFRLIVDISTHVAVPYPRPAPVMDSRGAAVPTG